MNEQDEIRVTISDNFSLDNIPDEADWFHLLTGRIDYLLQTDFNKLVSILYRMDISETRLSGMLRDNPGTDASEIIARMIIERQREKIKSRSSFQKPGDDIPEEDKW